MRPVPQTPTRPGFASVWVLTLFALVASFGTLLTVSHAKQRKAQYLREEQAQAHWLARAGEQIALQQLSVEPKSFSREVTDLVPGSKLKLRVTREEKEPMRYQIQCLAECQGTSTIPTRFELNRSVTQPKK